MTSPVAEQTIDAPIRVSAARAESHTSTYLALAGGILCIGFSGIWVRFADTTAGVVTFYRLGIAALGMLIPVLFRWRQGRARLSRAALPFALFAGVAFAADSFFFSSSVRLTTVANATLLGNTAPLWVGLASWLLLHEKLRSAYWLGLITALAGIMVIIGLDALTGLGTNVGNLLGLMSGVCYGTYLLITGRARRECDTLTYSFVFSATGALAALIYTQIFRHPLTGLPTHSYLALLALGLFSHVGGWLLINYAMGRLSASLTSVTLLLQPVITALIALPLLGEAPTIWHVGGGAITLAGIYLVHRSMAGSHKS
jgi:drug/metabolite transporter (DMT)-like permease